MAGGILSSIIRMTDKLAGPIRRSLGGSSSSSDPRDVEEDLKKLKRTLLRIDAVLNDAEEKETRDESVKLWLKELRGVAYDAEDLLDEFEYELLRSKLEAGVETTKATRKRKQGEVPHLIVSPLIDLAFRDEIVSRINKIRARFDEIASDRDALHLREEDGVQRRSKELVQPPSSSHVDQSQVYGREDDSNKVIELLLSDEIGGKNVSVIPIVGLGGVGKTTLVQIVYNNSRICEHFAIRAWVCVSEKFDVAMIAKAIIESITKSPCTFTELSSIQDALKEVLKGKKFLLVLDDVWNEKQSTWENLLVLLPSDVEGSRILVTTRNESVAKIMQTVPSFHLKCLSDEHCWLLFQRRAFGGRDPDAYPHLVGIGKMIAKKCKGLPLAAKTLGGLLHYETDEELWIDVLQSDLWDLDEGADEILPALRLSYRHLPPQLKRCFVYCSVFPKDFVFKKDQLVKLWMVQGFIQPKERKQAEDLGTEYFDDLLWRSFFQHTHLDMVNQEAFVMHDLISDLARSISEEECSLMEGADLCNLSMEARHVSLFPNASKATMQFQSSNKPRPLRTLLLIYRLINTLGGGPMWNANLLHVEIPNDLFLSMGCLRTLDLSYTGIKNLPDSIVNLKLLRYLSLRNTGIQMLPESICRLYNLQTLELQYCENLRELPQGIGNLINLRHLELPSMENSYICMPSGIGKLTGLQKLAAYNVGRDIGHSGIAELKELVNLRGELHVAGLRNVARGWDAKEANLKNKKNLQKLILNWYVHQTDYKCSHLKRLNFEDDWVSAKLKANAEAVVMPWLHVEEGVVLEGLEPHPDLKELEIRGYGGEKFERWVGDPTFSELVAVTLFNCEKCENLPPLGQLPSLKYLYIAGMANVRRVGPEFCSNDTKITNGFPALERLEFAWMPEWVEWCGVEEGGFPRLSELAIKNCPKLSGLPRYLAPSLTNLEIADSKKLTVLPSTPSLVSLNIGGDCDEQIWSYISDLRALQSFEVIFCENLRSLHLPNLPALKTLVIHACSQLTSIECWSGPAATDAASSSSSLSLMGLHNLRSLEQLKIENCPKLQFPVDECLPVTLQVLEISCCPLLMKWYREQEGSNQLVRISQVIVEDYDPDQFQEWVMDTEDEEDMEED